MSTGILNYLFDLKNLIISCFSKKYIVCIRIKKIFPGKMFQNQKKFLGKKVLQKDF